MEIENKMNFAPQMQAANDKAKIKNRIIFHPVLAFLNILMGFHLIDL